jgi:hypothetical protein
LTKDHGCATLITEKISSKSPILGSKIMLKKSCLSIALMTLPFHISTQTIDRIAIIDGTVSHINNQTKAIVLELRTLLSLVERSDNHFREQFKDNYPSTKEKCLAVLNTIAMSPEFTTTIEQITDRQVELIIEHNGNFNDIVTDPNKFPLEKKVKHELALQAFDQPTEQLFNVLYLAITITHGSKILLEKLAIKKNDLLVERTHLQPADEVVAA